MLSVTRATLRDEPALVRATVAALARGYRRSSAIPRAASATCSTARRPGARRRSQRELDAVSPAFTAGARAFGELDPQRLRAWARWEKRFGIVERAAGRGAAFDGRLVPRSDNRD